MRLFFYLMLVMLSVVVGLAVGTISSSLNLSSEESFLLFLGSVVVLFTIFHLLWKGIE